MSTNRIISMLLCLPLFAISCKNQEQPQTQEKPPVPVAVETVSTTDAAYYQRYPAIVRALNEVELRAQVGGFITGIYFKEGDVVTKGQKLYTIDQQQTQAAYQQALANLAVQEAALEKTRKDVERYRVLHSREAVAKQQYEHAEAAYEAAKKQVDAARAVVRGALTNLQYTTITAPFDGTIGLSQVKLGAAVVPGVTVLNTISSDTPVAADIVIDQSQIVKFVQLLNQKPAEGDSTFRLSIGDQKHPFPGRISLIDRAVDPQTGTMKLRVEFPNPGRRLRAGMNGVLSIMTRDKAAIVIPEKAIGEQLGEFFVYKVDNGMVSQTKIRRGERIGTGVIITEGLNGGETIVTEGIQNLKEGSAVATNATTEK